MKLRKLVLPMISSLLGLVAVLVFTGTVKVYKIPSGSMSPTIEPGDHVTATRVFKPQGEIAKGDLVIFDAFRAHPSLKSKFIQRVVALAGDTVDLIDDRLHVNGLPLPDRNGKIPRGAHQTDPRFPAPVYPLVVPAGEIFTLGDNHDNSLDSRYFGTFPLDAVTHRPGRVILPLSRAGKIE